MIPDFRNEIEGATYAERHKPYKHALAEPNGPDYTRRYGNRAADAAEKCRLAAISGDHHALHMASLALSFTLMADRPNLYDTARRKAA